MTPLAPVMVSSNSGEEIAASAASPEAVSPPPANIPPDLKALVEQFDKANQAAVSAQAKRQGWSPERFREELAKQNAITVQMHQVKSFTLSQLQLAVDNSATLENLAAAIGRRPEVVKRLAKMHLQTLIDKQITAQTFRQAQTLIKDPVQLASYYTAQLKKDILADDLLSLAAADRHPQTKENNISAALKNIRAEVAAETEKAKPAIETAAGNLKKHPSVTATSATITVRGRRSANRINLTKIESRPSKRKPWEYFFFVDFMGHQEDPKVSHALKALERHCTELKILGSYPVSHA